MSQKIINVGNAPDDDKGDPLRTSMQKVNDNFTEFYTAITPTGKNVGIGTTTPDSRLTVVADTISPAVRITQVGNGNALVVEDSENPDVTSFVINKDGNVGINKNLPTFPLDVNGDINTSGRLRFNAGTKFIGFQSGAYILPGADLFINSSKAITVDNFNTYAPTLTGDGASGLWDISVADATYATGSRTNTFSIGTSANFVQNGNFGINKALPQAKLHVGGNAIVNNNLTVNGSIVAGSLTSTVSGIYGISNTQTGVIGQSNTWVGIYGYSNTSHGIKGETSGTDGSSGVLGYSSKSPGVYGISDTFHGVIGTTEAPINTYFAGGAFVAYKGGIGINVESNTSIAINAKSNTGPLAIFSNNTNYGIVTIDNWGRLGLANTTPGHKLSVNGPSYFGSSLQLNGAMLVGSGSGSGGTVGQVLTSAGAGAAPTWSAPPSVGSTIVNAVEGDGQIHSRLFTTSSTWTVPNGVTRVKVYVIGGGAGGGGSVLDGENGTYGVAAGPGGFAVGEYNVTPGADYTVTVGAGGHGNNYIGTSLDSEENKGASGGASSFGPTGGSSLITASGGASKGASTGGTAGVGTGGTLRNSSMNRYSYGGSADNITKFQIDFAAGIFNGGHRSYSNDSSVRNPIAWSNDSESAPGIGGIGAGDQGVAQGGVSGIVYLEWVEARVSPTANPYVTLGKLGVTGDQYYWHVGSPNGGTYHSFPVAATTETVVPFIADTDDNDWHVSGNKFQPTKAGYYDIKSAILVYFVEAIDDLSSDLSVHSVNYQMVKNGTQRIVGDSLYDDLNKDRAYTQDITNNNRAKTFQVSSVVYMNGTTDYIQFTVYSYLLACRVMGEYIAADTVTTINYSKYSAYYLAYGGGGSGTGLSSPNSSQYIATGKLLSNFSIPAEGYDLAIPFSSDDDFNHWAINNKFVPNVAGYYNVESFIHVYWTDPLNSADVSVHDANFQIIKNGNERIAIDNLYDDLNFGQEYTSNVNNNDRRKTFQLSTVVYMNGTTDYLDFRFYSKFAATIVSSYVKNGATISPTRFSAFLIGGGGSGSTTNISNFLDMTVYKTAGSQNFTVPAGVTMLKVTVTGGGGAGGTGSGSTGGSMTGGGGGGGGGTVIEILRDVVPGTVIPVTVGAGGICGTGIEPTNGGSSSFGSYCSATGGVAGDSFGSGGAGGVGSGGDLNISGQGGGAGSQPSEAITISGTGGSSYYGAGGAGVTSNGLHFGEDARGYGAGGSGGVGGHGGNGSSGVVTIEYDASSGASNIYTGTNTENVDFPVGSYVTASLSEGGPGLNRNAHTSLYILDNLNKSLMYTADSFGTIAQLTGTWAYRTGNLFQRIS